MYSSVTETLCFLLAKNIQLQSRDENSRFGKLGRAISTEPVDKSKAYPHCPSRSKEEKQNTIMH